MSSTYHTKCISVNSGEEIGYQAHLTGLVQTAMSRFMIKQLLLGPMANFAYLIGDEGKDVCAVVDPGWDAGAIVNASSAQGWEIDKILLTHAHFDHAGAIEQMIKLTHAPVYIHHGEEADLPKDAVVIRTEDDTVIDVGGLKVSCIHTPGHTPGSQCFLVDGALLTGDTLFVDGCGRVDLPGSSPLDMLSSLRRISKMDRKIVIYPGHDYGPTPTSTIGAELERNPYLRATSEEMLL